MHGLTTVMGKIRGCESGNG